MYQDSSCISLSVRVIKLEVIFRKALYKTTFSLQSLTSSEIQPLQESVKNKTNDSESEENKLLNEYASKSAPIVFRKSSQIVVSLRVIVGSFLNNADVQRKEIKGITLRFFFTVLC